MPQQQHNIEVKFRNGKPGLWYTNRQQCRLVVFLWPEQPLVGYSDSIQPRRASSNVECPDCGHVFKVVAPGLRQVPNHIEELEAG
jgi:hypothetical protein